MDILYTAENCPYCERVCIFLLENNIPFKKEDIKSLHSEKLRSENPFRMAPLFKGGAYFTFGSVNIIEHLKDRLKPAHNSFFHDDHWRQLILAAEVWDSVVVQEWKFGFKKGLQETSSKVPLPMALGYISKVLRQSAAYHPVLTSSLFSPHALRMKYAKGQSNAFTTLESSGLLPSILENSLAIESVKTQCVSESDFIQYLVSLHKNEKNT